MDSENLTRIIELITALCIVWALRHFLLLFAAIVLRIFEFVAVLFALFGSVYYLFNAQWINAVTIFFALALLGGSVRMVRKAISGAIALHMINKMGAGTANQVASRSHVDLDMVTEVLEELCRGGKLDRIELENKSILYRSLAPGAENGDNIVKSEIEIQMD